MTCQPINILHIVRRYGPVGGMEGYVWELTRKLADSGCQISILCETLHTDIPENIKVHQLGDITKKPRWLAALRFSRRARLWLQCNPQPERLIHSHESTGFHHVTTFHGPPFAHVRQRPFWKNMSLRVQANLWLEQREVCGEQVQAVIPNSELIRERLQMFYPCIGARMANPIIPGVAQIPQRPKNTPPNNAGVIGFVGKEWKRKGLDTAIAIVKNLRKTRPDLELHVAGPKPEAIRHLFANWEGGYQLLGETDARPLFKTFDLLLHPARMEPFGMVVTEALRAQVPVVISDQCGARSEVVADRVLPIEASVDTWAETCLEALGKPQPIYQRSWQQVAEEHHKLYRQLLRHAG